MAAPADNILRQVITYQKYSTAALDNLYAVINQANKKFLNFQDLEANLGDTVSWEKPYRYVATDTLVTNFQGTEQRIIYLTVDQSKSVGRAFNDQQFLFNAEQYMDKMGVAAMKELGSAVESNVAENFINHTFRFYGNGKDAIDSYGKLADALEVFREYGAPDFKVRGFLPNRGVWKIINSGLQQFVIDRNEKDARSWMVGAFEGCDWYRSNLLKQHTAGTIGQSLYDVSPLLLTVVSFTQDAAGNITSITFSGGPVSDSDAVKAGDLFQFSAIPGENDGSFNFLTFTGHKQCSAPVQFAAAADAASDGSGNVTIVIDPTKSPLNPTSGDKNQNLPYTLSAGMNVWGAASHAAGCINAGDTLYLAMPRLPNTEPYASSNQIDSESGASCRMYYGTILQSGSVPTKGIVNDIIWGSTMDHDSSMRLCFPVR